MRIALFTETFLPKIDGVVNTLCRLLKHLEKNGHRAMVFAPADSPPRFGNTHIVRLPGAVLPFYRELKLLTPVFPVLRFLRPFKPDVIHLVNPFSLGPVGLWAGRRMGVPVISSYHTDLPGFIEKWGYRRIALGVDVYLRMIHNLTATTLCPSFATREILENKGFERVGIWSRGVERERFSPEKASPAMRHRLTNGDVEKPLLIYVGRLSKEKKVDCLIDMVRAIPDMRLAIVGDGPHRRALEEVMANDRVVFTGYLTDDDLVQAYASADVFVFPSENDTFGNVVLEAMASGLPVVAARSGGPLDMVHHGENGFLFEPGDVRNLIGGVRRIVDDADLYAQMQAGALKEAQSRSWKAVMDGLLDVYHQYASASECLKFRCVKDKSREPVLKH